MNTIDAGHVVRRLATATNDHDIDGLVRCFADDYVNETPAHPARGFHGSEQVRRNWTQLFAGIPDLSVEVLATAVDGADVWSEWRMSGTRRDGIPHLTRGVIIFTIAAERIIAGRFFLEPVDESSDGADATIARFAGEPLSEAKP